MTHRSDEDVPRDEIADRVLDRLVAALPADAEMDGDRSAIARSVDAALLRRANVAHVAPAVSRKWPLVAAAAAAVVAVGAMTILGRSGAPPAAPPVVAPAAVISEATPAKPIEQASEVPTLDVSALPTAPSARAPAAAAPAGDARTAAEIFASANDARRRRDVPRARSFYLELQSKFPKSAEAVTSYVTLGRLELDHGRGQEALAQFDRYVASSASELREDALAGRASALESLGRVADEKRAWQVLLTSYPTSLFAPHARQRMAISP